MADNLIESVPSSSAQQPQAPASSHHSTNPVIPLVSAELHVEANPLPPPSSRSSTADSGESANTVSPGSTTRPAAEEDEPEPKRKKLDSGRAGPAGSANPTQHEKLEYRLGGILCCAVCLDLPKTAMYQCQMGHLMCAACFTHLLADGRLRDQVATCPNCRVEISKNTASRNLAVEKAASELPSECQFCNQEFPSKSLERHEQCECEERPTNCKYFRIGCQWKGPVHEAPEHERTCSHPKKSGFDVMAALQMHDAKHEEERKLYSTLIDLLSYEKIIFNERIITYKSESIRAFKRRKTKFHKEELDRFSIIDLQMKPYRTDEYVHKLFYETSRFSAFNHQFVVKARINKSQRDPHQSNERQITYQLILKSKTTSPLSIHFFALKGPFSDMKVNTQIYKHDFTDENNESEYYLLPLPDSSECNRLLAAKAINFRLLMFLLAK